MTNPFHRALFLSEVSQAFQDVRSFNPTVGQMMSAYRERLRVIRIWPLITEVELDQIWRLWPAP